MNVGMMVWVVRFHSAVSLIGMTGCTLRMKTVSSFVPAPKLKLLWNGTLMRSATGFCVFLASSVALSSSAPSRLRRAQHPGEHQPREEQGQRAAPHDRR
ncbi:MAG: hypothetical protein ACREK6_07460, partial [Candidatus Rokuibacteriota bacterium]